MSGQARRWAARIGGWALAALGCAGLVWSAPPEKPPGAQAGRPRVQAPAAALPAPQLAQRVLFEHDGRMLGERAGFVEPPRETLRALRRAGELLEAERYSEAIGHLGAILAAPDDGVLPAEPGQPMRYLKAEALRLVGQMPPKAREEYELQFGAKAARLLEEAAARGDIAGVEQVAGQFLHTQAGGEAMFVLGNYHFDHGRPLAAALCYDRLRKRRTGVEHFEPALSLRAAVAWLWAGSPEKARDALVALKRRNPSAQLALGGQNRPLFANDSEALAWLTAAVGPSPALGAGPPDQWKLVGGDPARNARSSGGVPLLSHRWFIPIADDPRVRELVAQLHERYREQNLTALAGLQPLVVHDGKRDLVLMRTLHNLLAVDFNSGKRVWMVPVEESFEELLQGPRGASPHLPQLVASLDERLWDDAAYGSLSSDGQYVYAIEDLSSAGLASSRSMMIVMPNGNRTMAATGPTHYNRLAAFELRTEGKLKWALGGPPGDQALPEAETFFLGAPLPVGGRLYVLGEVKGQLRLLAIDPTKDPYQGEPLVEWSLPLVNVEQDITQDPLRRLGGVSPSYADGVLICPTAAGAVVAVDVTTRSLLWGYQYPSDLDVYQGRLAALQMNLYPGGDTSGLDRWLDATVTIAGGRVLVAPPDSHELDCLNLADGSRAWQEVVPREDGLYIGCAQDGKVLVVGSQTVRALELADGKLAWGPLPLPSGSKPSGRGYCDAARYYLPLSSGEVAVIELATGRTERVSSRRGDIPGNLVCYKGAVISQSVEGVKRFEQFEVQKERVLARLKENPDDAEALVERAEVLLDAGKLAEAAADLRRALALKPAPHVRELLVETLLERLRTDFAAHRADAKELEALVEEPADRIAYLRLLAEGLEQAGEWLPAFQAYLRLAEVPLDQEPLQQVSPALSVRQDRWVQARLPGLLKRAGAEAQAAIDREIAARFEQARSGSAPEALRRFIRYFDGHPLAAEARLALADRLNTPAARLEVELLLRQVERSGSAAHSRAATARLAQLLEQAGRPEQAALYYRRLAGELAEEVCLDGKTGRQLVEALAGDSAVGAWLAKPPAWPRIEVKSDSAPLKDSTSRSFAFDATGSPDPVFADTLLELNQRQTVTARDGLGRKRWSIALGGSAARNALGFNYAFRARLHGNFSLVAIGNELFAIDGLSGAETGRVLWQQSLQEAIPGLEMPSFPFRGQFGVPFGGRIGFPGGIYAQPQAVLGPATNSLVCFQRGRSLLALDPLSGETLWSRNEIPPGSNLFGDDEVVLIAPPASTEAVVLRALDGEELDRVEIPPEEVRLALVGRRVLAWKPEDDGRLLAEMLDPVEGKTVWRAGPFSHGAKASLWRQSAMAVAEPDGRILVLDLADGRKLVDSRVEPEPALHEVYLLGAPEQWIVAVNRYDQNDPRMQQTHPFPGGLNNPKIDGHLHAFDRTRGEKLWSVRVEKQSLVLDQPSDVPVLVLACHRVSASGGRTSGAVLVLDKQTGQAVVSEQQSGPLGNLFELSGDLEQKTVDLKVGGKLFRMRFIAAPPAPPAGPAEAAKEKSPAVPAPGSSGTAPRHGEAQP